MDIHLTSVYAVYPDAQIVGVDQYYIQPRKWVKFQDDTSNPPPSLPEQISQAFWAGGKKVLLAIQITNGAMVYEEFTIEELTLPSIRKRGRNQNNNYDHEFNNSQ